MWKMEIFLYLNVKILDTLYLCRVNLLELGYSVEVFAMTDTCCLCHCSLNLGASSLVHLYSVLEPQA